MMPFCLLLKQKQKQACLIKADDKENGGYPQTSAISFFNWFTPCKTEQPLRGMELREKEAQQDYSI